jgi:hypothetical protein
MLYVYLEEKNNNIIIDLMILSEYLTTNSDLMMTLYIYKISHKNDRWF